MALAIVVSLEKEMTTPAGVKPGLGKALARESDRLDTAAQMVRQDRANWHKFGRGDAEDQDDPWFASTSSRAKFEQMLNKGSAMSQGTRRAIVNGEPVVEVQVFRQSVRVRVIGN